jgi:hypothetical protein
MEQGEIDAAVGALRLSAGFTMTGRPRSEILAMSPSCSRMIVRGTGRSCASAKLWNEALLESVDTIAGDGIRNR